MQNRFLPGVPVDRVLACYSAAPGNEIESGKFDSPESSAALVANALGWFIGREADLPPLPGTEDRQWPALSLDLERIVRFPWSGGRHPCLDALIATRDALIGVESKRYEPFRATKDVDLSEAYQRPVWGGSMGGYALVRDGLRNRELVFQHLDAVQLVKHAFGLRTAVHKEAKFHGKTPVLFYLFAEPERWPGPGGRPIQLESIQKHRKEVADFAALIAGDEVAFAFCSYRDLIAGWNTHHAHDVREHAGRTLAHFGL
jgi:hypothetical protein